MSELPWREYDGAAQRALGVRYATVCEVAAGPEGGHDHGYLLWADEPFTAVDVAREMTARGFTVTAVTEGRSAWHPWVARISAGPGTTGPRYVVAFGRDYTSADWLGLWSPAAGMVVRHSTGTGWTTVPTLHSLYGDKGFWADPHDWVAVVTTEQAERVAALLGSPLPGVRELGAGVGAELDLRRRRQELWAEFTAHRRERFATQLRQVLGEVERLAAVEPLRREVRHVRDREREAELIPAVRVPVGEPFPLAGFLIGAFAARVPGTVGRHEAVCGRLAVIAPDGERLDLVLDVTLGPATGGQEEAFTPYCPAEAAYRDDPALPGLLAAEPPSADVPPLVFPVSPALMTIGARPLPASREPGMWRDLRPLLTFPDGTEYVASRGWSGSGFRWARFRSGRDGLLFVPDHIDILKGVRARFTL